MASPIEAILLLCDSAVADPSGKVHMLGAGWTSTGSPTAPSAVVAMIKVPWDRANQKITLELDLLDSDGKSVELPTDGGTVSLRAAGTVEVGRPPGLAHGSPLPSAFVLNVPSLPLKPARYEWRLKLAEESFVVAFQVG